MATTGGPYRQIDDDGSQLLDARGYRVLAAATDPRCCCKVSQCGPLPANVTGRFTIANICGSGLSGAAATCYLASFTGIKLGTGCYPAARPSNFAGSAYKTVRPTSLADASGQVRHHGSTGYNSATTEEWVSLSRVTTFKASVGFNGDVDRCKFPQDPYNPLNLFLWRMLLRTDPTVGYWACALMDNQVNSYNPVLFYGYKRICCCNLPTMTFANALTAPMLGLYCVTPQDGLSDFRLSAIPPGTVNNGFQLICGYGGTMVFSIINGGC